MKISLSLDKIPGSQHNFGHGINYMTKEIQISREMEKGKTRVVSCYVCWVE